MTAEILAARKRVRPLASATAVALLTLGAGFSTQAAEPPADHATPSPNSTIAPADPLANLGPDASAVFDVGGDPSLLLTETDHGVKAPRTLKIGDEYRDGWKINAIAARSATLGKGGQTRTVVLTGLPQVAVAPSSAAPASATLANSRPSGDDPQRAAALAAAIASGNTDQVFALGGTAKDLATARLISFPALRLLNPDPDSAQFVRTIPGPVMPQAQVGLAMKTYSGTAVGAYVWVSPLIQSYAPIESLPTREEALGPTIPSAGRPENP